MPDLVATLTLVSGGGLLPPPVPLGDAVTLRLAVTDVVTGEAYAATAPALSVIRPDGAAYDYSEDYLAPAGVGVWTKAIVPDRRGRWLARGTATGTATATLVITALPGAGAPIEIAADDRVPGQLDLSAARNSGLILFL